MQPPSAQKAPPLHLSASRSANGIRPAKRPVRTAALHGPPRQRIVVAATSSRAPVAALTVERPTVTNEMATSASTTQPICSAQRRRPASYARSARAASSTDARSADSMVPPRGAQPHQRAFEALTKRRRCHSAGDISAVSPKMAARSVSRSRGSSVPSTDSATASSSAAIACASGSRAWSATAASASAPPCSLRRAAFLRSVRHS